MAESGIGLAEALLGLDGFRVQQVTEGENEALVRVETTAEMVACLGNGPNQRIGLSGTSGTFPVSEGRPDWCGGSPWRHCP